MWLFSEINYLAVFVTAIIYWLLGWFWFSVLFRKVWTCETSKECKMEKPTRKVFITKMIITYILNLIVVFGVAIFVNALNVQNFVGAIILGLILGICFAAAPMRTSSLWSGRSCKLAAIDYSYPIVGIIISAIILTYWR